MKYDYLIVGTGLFGATFAYEATRKGKRCIAIDRRAHVGGNIYTELTEGINVHIYGPHIFHTHDKKIWEYINQFAEFNRFTYMPVAIYKNEIYNLPFNMNTFNQLWGIKTPAEAKAKIAEQIKNVKINSVENLEAQALSLVGKDIYEKLIKGYTEKQWGKHAVNLPEFIIKRIPIRFMYDNNYFNDPYQGIPVGGYTKVIEKMLEGTDVKLNTDYAKCRNKWDGLAKKIVFTGMIDEYYDFCFGNLEYRSLKFETEILNEENHQGNAVVNYTEYEVPYTRIIEHKHFEFGTQEKTIITKEYPVAWKYGDEAYYPINDEINNQIYNQYRALSEKDERKVIFGGRLGSYLYLNMDQVMKRALECAEKELS